MAKDRRVQSLIFVVRGAEPNPSIKAYVLLPLKLEIGPKVTEVLKKHDIQIIRNEDSLSSFCQESDQVEIMEVLFDEADVLAKVPDGAKVGLAYETCNREAIKGLFGDDFCFKSKLNYDSHLPVIDGSEDVLNLLNLLSSYKTDISYASAKGGTFLHFAAESGLSLLIELLLKKGANASAGNNDGETPLHIVAKKGHLDQARLLIENGALVNAKTTANYPKDSTPLHYAINYKHVELVKLLLKHGADVDALESSGTPLLLAVKRRNIDLVKAVLEYRPKAEIPQNEQAFREGIVDSRLYHGSLVKLMNPDEETFRAVVSDPRSVGHYLRSLMLKYNYTPPTFEVMSCGDWCIIAGEKRDREIGIFHEICNEARKKAKKAKEDEGKGKTALHIAASEGNADAIRNLVRHGADINVKSKEGKTPMHYVPEKEPKEYEWPLEVDRAPSPVVVAEFDEEDEDNMFVAITSEGGDPNARDDRGRTPLFDVVDTPRFIDIRHLLDCGADIDARDNDGMTPLHVAAANGFVIYVEALVHNGADIEAKCNEGKTALMYAVGNDRFDAAISLLLHDARIDVDHAGRTALNEAYEGYLPKLTEILLAYCYTDLTSLKLSVMGQPVPFKRRFLERTEDDMAMEDYYKNSSPREVSLTEFQALYDRHVVRTRAAVPATRGVEPMTNFTAEEIDEFKRQCELEVVKMKTLPVGDSGISFADILTYSQNRLAALAKNVDFVTAMEEFDYTGLPVYGDILQLKFQQACRRKKLLERRGLICKLFCPEYSTLLDEVKERIVSFLSTSDLAMLQIACTRILASQDADVHEKEVNEECTRLCCRTRPPRALVNKDDSFTSSMRIPNREKYEEPYWYRWTRTRISGEPVHATRLVG